ncbi:MAG: immune inhibitor A [Flavobacteriia bacterium]|nr:immune inhibitor A [Flavobacteriia bacterium]
MKKWLPLLGLLLLGTTSHAQFVTLFQENFDSTNVTTTSETEDNLSGAVTTGGWSLNTTLQVSSPNSMKGQRTANKTKYLYTAVFSTANLTNARLEFDHICKLNFLQQGRVEYTVDGGTTWTLLPGSAYLGNSPGYASTVYFNGASYANPGAQPYWDPFSNVTPTNNWWAHETFDLTNIMVSTGAPYTQCQIRWSLVDVNPNATTFNGWYIDNIDIIGSTCELQPPVLNWTTTGSRQPIGPRYQANQKIELNVSDAGAGVDSVLLTYSINGAPDTTVLMSGASSCPASSQYTYTIMGLTVGDTVEWKVYAEDCACPNTAQFPDQAAANPYAKFWIDPAPPLKCGTTTSNSFPYIVANFPFTESFENPALWAPGSGTGATGSAHRGTWPTGPPPGGRNWQVSPSANLALYAWSVRSGGTGTANTGPDGDGTTGSGNYLYTEASQPNQGGGAVGITSVVTPCFDLPPNSCSVLEFKYHMYGSDLNVGLKGVLRVDVDTSTGMNNQQYVNAVGIVVGEQNIGSGSAWNTMIIPLEQFAGQTVNFRFLGVNRSSGDKQDIAIDDISVYEPDPVDFEMLSFGEPTNGLCSYSNAEDVEITLRSRGCLEQDSIPVGFSVSLNGGTPVIHNDVITDTMALGDVLTHLYNPKADLSGYGNFEIYAWVDMPGDPDATNDTIGPLFIEHVQPINTFPYTIDFDGAGWQYGGGTISNPGTYGNPDWLVLPPINSANLAFVVGNQVTEDFNTGPRYDMSGDGNYLYTDVRTPGTHFARYELDRCIDMTNMTNPSFSFWYHMYGPNINFVKVQYQLDGSTQWFDAPGGTVSGTQQADENEDWRYKQVDLSTFAGGLVRLRFIVQSTGTGSRTDLAIDNILLWDEDGQTDVGASIITSPGYTSVNLAAANKPDLKVKVTNFGESPVSNVPVTVVVTDLCDASKTNTVNFTVSGPLAPHSVTEVTLPQPTYYFGGFEMLAYTSLTGDANTFNDTAYRHGTGFRPIAIPYSDNFDSCTYNTKGWFSQGGLFAWEHGTPQKGSWNSAYSGANSWNLANEFDYQNQAEILRVPPLIEFDTVVGAILRLRHRFNFSSGDAGRMEYFYLGQWNVFGFSSQQVGLNWYGDGSVPAFGGGEAWTGSQPWTLSEFPLSIWNFRSNPLFLRFIMQNDANTNGGTGWSIDDFDVIVPPQNSVSPIWADTKEYLVVPNQPATIVTRIKNTGEKVLQGCLVRFRINGGQWYQWDSVPQANWFKGRVVKHEFNFKTDPMPPGVYTIDVQTSRPVSDYDSLPKADNRPADDLYSFQVTVLDEVTPTADSSAYCNDFEDPSKTPLVALHSFNKQLDQEWEEGNPTNPNLPGAYSGTNAWATDLDSNYNFLTESSLHTPFFVLTPDTTYKFSFWHQMNGEQYHDGGGIEFSFNGGITWYALGSVNPNGTWYNTNHVTSLDRLNGGWSGQFSWIRSEATFQVDTPGTVVFRWRFGADYTIEGAGWTIDDFCFNTTTDPTTTGPISIDENDAPVFTDVSLYPNPADDYTFVDVITSVGGEAKVSVNNLVGQTLYESTEQFHMGKNSLDLNTEQYTSGVYILTIDMNGVQSNVKFVVTHE